MDLTREVLITIQLDKFKNIELFKQGLYQIRFRISYMIGNTMTLGQPSKIFSHSEKIPKKSSESILPAHILDEYSCFNSRVILVRYQEETLSLLESCVFLCRFPNSATSFSVKIHADLYFTNLEFKEKPKGEFRKLNTSPKFNCVASKEYIITNAFNSSTYYMPMSFDPKYFCIIDSLIHVYTARLTCAERSQRMKLFNDTIIGGVALDKTYYSIIDTLYISYNNIRKFCLELSEFMEISASQIPIKINLPFIDNPEGKTSLYDVISTHSANKASKRILEEVAALSDVLEISMEKMLYISMANSVKVVMIYKNKFFKEVWEHFQEYIQVEEILYRFPTEYTDSIRNLQKAIGIRNCDYYNNMRLLPIQAEDLYSLIETHPIYFIHSDPGHIKGLCDSTPSKTAEIHVLFLMHGYKGSSVDMHMIKGYINMIYPTVHVYSCKSNENFTDSNIEILGENLAEEVIHYLHEVKVPKHRLKISFIGHSLGGLILRSAFPLLSEYKACMNFVATFSSPHIGIVYTNSALLQFGKWIVKKLQKSDSFMQMTLKDSKVLRDTFIYKLSNAEGLNWFKHVLFFACNDDPYVPLESAGIYVPQKSAGSKKHEFFKETVENILDKINIENFIRVEVDFKSREFLDNFLFSGNRHIDFLDDPCFIKMFCYSMPKLFL